MKCPGKLLEQQLTTQRFHLWIVLLMLNDLFRVYMETKTNLKESTESNYRYLWEHYIQHEPIAEKALSKIHKSDVKLLYAKLLQEGFASNSLESINNLIHPVLELAVDDDLIRKNPSNGVYHEMKTNAPVQRIALTSEQAKHFLQYIELIIIIPSFSNYNNVSFVSD